MGEGVFVPPDSHSRFVSKKYRIFIPALPFCNVALRAKKPLSASYPKELKTLGDHLKKRRFDLKMLQKEVAEKLNTTVCTYRNWERDLRNPSYRYIPRIIKFLGYVPFDIPHENLGQKIRTYRQLLGLSQRDLARQIGVDPCTIASWERSEHKPEKRLKRVLDVFLSSVTKTLLSMKDFNGR